MTKFRPVRAANELTRVLRAVGVDAFPVDVKSVALEISRQKYPDDSIVDIKGDKLTGFEGALLRAPRGKQGWGIIYNSGVTSRGRINFTLGHEFGHYLLHRRDYPEGFTCSTEDMANWESEYAQRESEANTFAATLLMPLDDFRAQIDSHSRPDFDVLGYCADRYDVSLIAATLRWLQYTSRRSILIVSRDEFILWARSSQSALRSRLYFKTRNTSPIAVPPASLAANKHTLNETTGTRDFADDVWFDLPCTEHAVFSVQYDFTLSLVHFADADSRVIELEDPIEDAADRIRNRTPGEPWLR